MAYYFVVGISMSRFKYSVTPWCREATDVYDGPSRCWQFSNLSESLAKSVTNFVLLVEIVFVQAWHIVTIPNLHISPSQFLPHVFSRKPLLRLEKWNITRLQQNSILFIWNEMKEEVENFFLKACKWRRKDYCIIYA